jgi:hypothetical protein
MNRGRVAQMVEHWSNKPMVAGSIPVTTIFFFLSFFPVELGLPGFEPGFQVSETCVLAIALQAYFYESYVNQASIVQWLEFVPSKHEARVRFPVDAL